MLIHKRLFSRFTVASAVFTAGVFSLFTMSASHGASNHEIEMRYKADVAACNSGQSGQDKATCLKEAGAALAAARKNKLTDNSQLEINNKTARCNALPADQRDDCLMQMSGANTTSTGSVEGGGILRETTITIPAN